MLLAALSHVMLAAQPAPAIPVLEPPTREEMNQAQEIAGRCTARAANRDRREDCTLAARVYFMAVVSGDHQAEADPLARLQVRMQARYLAARAAGEFVEALTRPSPAPELIAEFCAVERLYRRAAGVDTEADWSLVEARQPAAIAQLRRMDAATQSLADRFAPLGEQWCAGLEGY